MDPLMRSFVWGFGLLVLMGVALVVVIQLRRRFTAAEEVGDPVAGAARVDWVALLTAIRGDRLAPRDWSSRAGQLSAQAASCPSALRAPLIAALDGAIARSGDPFASAGMTQVRSALAALPAA